MKNKYLLALLVCAPVGACAQAFDPAFQANYSFVSLTVPSNVTPNYGGLCLLSSDPNVMLIGGSANSGNGKLFQVGVIRDAQQHITGFTTATEFASAPYNDGGVGYGPGGLLFASRYPTNEIAMYKPGSTTPDRVISLAGFGVASSHSAFAFGPSWSTFAGKMKASSWSGGQFYDMTYALDNLGLLDVSSATQTATLQGGPEGFAYVKAGSPQITTTSMIVSEYSSGQVSLYDVNVNGDPITSTRRTFMTGLGGAEGAFVDPLTGDFLFSTYGGGNRLIRVSGFAVPEPAHALWFGLGAFALVARRRKRS